MCFIWVCAYTIKQFLSLARFKVTALTGMINKFILDLMVRRVKLLLVLVFHHVCDKLKDFKCTWHTNPAQIHNSIHMGFWGLLPYVTPQAIPRLKKSQSSGLSDFIQMGKIRYSPTKMITPLYPYIFRPKSTKIKGFSLLHSYILSSCSNLFESCISDINLYYREQ